MRMHSRALVLPASERSLSQVRPVSPALFACAAERRHDPDRLSSTIRAALSIMLIGYEQQICADVVGRQGQRAGTGSGDASRH